MRKSYLSDSHLCTQVNGDLMRRRTCRAPFLGHISVNRKIRFLIFIGITGGFCRFSLRKKGKLTVFFQLRGYQDRNCLCIFSGFILRCDRYFISTFFFKYSLYRFAFGSFLV